jgi:hypothetical protein
MVGSPRTGSTWLLNLLATHPTVRAADEPLIGAHLGLPASATVGAVARNPQPGQVTRALDFFADRDDYFFSERYADAWREPLRRLVLARLLPQLRAAGGDPRQTVLVVKEPHGSEAADLLARTLPRSRVLAVVRDGRDVVDSILDALQPGAWASSLAQVDAAERLRFVEDYAGLWAERTRVVLRAVAESGERALLVRYEDLLADTATHLRRILRWMGLEPAADLDEHVERLAFHRVDEAHRGSGKFHRAATPGLWRDNLAADEQAAATTVMAPLLTELGYPVD